MKIRCSVPEGGPGPVEKVRWIVMGWGQEDEITGCTENDGLTAGQQAGEEWVLSSHSGRGVDRPPK